MAKIENTTVYPLVTPNADDFIIGTDTSDGNRTVSFSIENLTASGGLQGLQSVLGEGNAAVSPMTLTGNLTVYGSIVPTTITAAASVGSSGQILSSTGAGIQWVDSTSAQDLESVLTVGNTATLDITMSSSDINSTGSINMSGAAQVLALSTNTDMTLAAGCDITTSGNINLSGGSSVLNFGTTAEINDSAGSTGAIGSILTVDAAGTGVEWSTGIPVASMPTLQQVLTSGDTANSNPMNLTAGSTLTLDGTSNIVSAGANVFTGTNTFSANGSSVTTAGVVLSGSLWDGANTGTSNQVLTSTGTGVQWKDVSAVGVSSVEASPPQDATASSTPITITPTTGSVEVIQNIYNGGSLIGCVPAGGAAGFFLQGDGTWADPAQGAGTVTSVDLSVPSGFTVSGNPITSSGTITIAGAGTTLDYINGLGNAVAISTLSGVGTVTSVSAAMGGDAFIASVASATTTPAIAITANGAVTDYVNGLGNLIALDTLPQGTVESLTTNGSSGDATLLSGVLNIPNYAAGVITTLTTNGTSGLASLVSDTLNIPNYTAGVTDVSTVAPLSSSGGVTPTLSIALANASTNGYLSSTDWTTFNNNAGGGVSSVTTTTPIDAASPLTPITIMPTSAAVLVRQNIYNGGNLIGCVPDGGTSSTFLRGDGTWAAAAGSSAPEGYMSYLFNTVRQAYVANNYYTLTSIGQTAQRLSFDTDLGASSPAAMSVAMTDIEHVAGCFLYAPTGVTCGSAYPNMKVCDMNFQFVGDADSAGASWEIQLWKTSQCTSGTYTLAGEAAFSSISADTLYCRIIAWESTALQTLAPGEAFFITAKADTAVASGDFQLNTSIRWKGVA